MARNRIYVMLPTQSVKQSRAARLVLAALRYRFPAGGTWVSLENMEPVCFGWWQGIIDDHVLVFVDHESSQETRPLDDAAELIAAVFRKHYSAALSLEECVISITSHSIGVHNRPGKIIDVEPRIPNLP